MSTQLTTKDLFGKKSIQERFEAILGKKAQGFISSVLQVINSNNLLSNAKHHFDLEESLYNRYQHPVATEHAKEHIFFIELLKRLINNYK